MEKKTVKTLLLIASAALLVAGLIFLGLSMYAKPKNTAYTAAALGAILLANLFNIIRGFLDRKK